MEALLNNPTIQYGALGLAFLLNVAGIRAFFALMSQRHEQQRNLFSHHAERERLFAKQFMACIDRNSAALEKVELGLQRIYIQLARLNVTTGEEICFTKRE